MLAYRGELDSTLSRDETLGPLAGSFEYPFTYGYSAVGTVEASRTDLGEGERVFAFHPHQTRFVVTAADVVPIGDCNPRTATLFPLLETALQISLDTGIRHREVAAVVGLGPIGILTATSSRGAVRSSSEVIQSRGAARSPKRVGSRPSNRRSSATQYAPRRGTRCGLHRRGDGKSGGAGREPRHPLGRGCRDRRFLVWPEAGHPPAGCRVSSAAPRDPKQPGLDSRPPSRPLGSAAEARDDSGTPYGASTLLPRLARSRWSAHQRRTRPLTAATSASSTSPSPTHDRRVRSRCVFDPAGAAPHPVATTSRGRAPCARLPGGSRRRACGTGRARDGV